MATAPEQLATIGARASVEEAIATRRPSSVGRWLVAPALIYAIIVTQVPFFLTLYYSTYRWNLLRPELKKRIWLENYRRTLFDDSIFREAAVNTLIFTVSAVAISLVLGLFYAELV